MIVGVFFQLDSHFMLILIGNVIFEQQMHDDKKPTIVTENEKKDTMANYSFNIWMKLKHFYVRFHYGIFAAHHSISLQHLELHVANVWLNNNEWSCGVFIFRLKYV